MILALYTQLTPFIPFDLKTGDFPPENSGFFIQKLQIFHLKTGFSAQKVDFCPKTVDFTYENHGFSYENGKFSI